ncbi:outer membrane protein assembly factor [Flavobacteriaceae bacterium F08102]|nr:outer membrane protein assembly factor [Flavobacteriaceae bacterium F08102]
MKDNKSLSALPNYFAKILVFLICVTAIISCDATKRVPKGSYLLDKNQLIVNEQKSSDPEVLAYLRQKPNTKILGYPFSLHLYNLGNPNYDRNFEKWLNNNPKKKKRFVNFFSEKQVAAMGNTLSGLNEWFLKNGNAPVISDSLQIIRSVNSLTDYYRQKGYFDVEVSSETSKKKNKKIEVKYHITTFEPYFIDSLTTSISSPVLDSLYQLNKDKSLIIPGNKIDYQDFENEATRLEKLFRNSGVYNYRRDAIKFWIDSLTSSSVKNVLLEIPDLQETKGDSTYLTPYTIKKIKKVEIVTDFSFSNKDRSYQDSAVYNNYHFYAYGKLKHNPKYLSNAIVIQPKGVYKDTERDLTRDYLRQLQNFKSININYQENEDHSLTAKIILTPLKKRSLGFDMDLTTSNVKPFGILGKFSWMDRNMFKGAEILELSFQGSFLNADRDFSDNSRFFNAWELGTSANLTIPRIWFPININRIIPKRMTPKTNFSISLNVQRNIGLDRRNLTGALAYNWKSSKTTDHKFELFNIQYIENLRLDKYFDIFSSEEQKLIDVQEVIPDIVNPNNPLSDPLAYIDYVLSPSQGFETSKPDEFNTIERVKERRDILIEDVLVPVMSYTFNYSNRESFTDQRFSALTARLVSAGNITNLFLKKPANGDKKEIFGLPVAQYIKPEFEYKKYWPVGLGNTLVYRAFVGAAIPLGNSTDVPFSRSYRAGGSNDIRAWGTFNLGPGSSENNLEFNTGTFKFTTNLEYRFNVLNNLNSALFIDAGNIWDITNTNISTSEGKLKGLSSLKEIAIGTGFGLRYDLSFLVFRLDVGFKTYEPYLKNSNRWFKNYNFTHAVYNIGINYPF